MPTKTNLITHIIQNRWCIFIIFNILFLINTVEAQSKESKNQYKTTQLKDNPKRKNKIRTIVIDAGHGGHDPGTVNFKKKEKDITLGIALKTGELIKRNFKDIKVIYTRKTDEFIDLKKRAQIANQARADLFISIHCNAIETNQENFYGTETYVQDPKVESYNLDVAKRENSAILLEDDYKAHYDGFDPNAPETHIMLSMFQNAFLGQSISFAQAFEMESANFGQRKSRGVRQAGFLVLKATTMPSVLIETGFLSNDNEKDFLTSDEGQGKMAAIITRAFAHYKLNIEQNQPILARTNLKLDLNLGKKHLNDESYQSEKQELSQTETKSDPKQNIITFRLQLLASQTLIDTSSGILKGIDGLQMIKEGNMYKYYGKAHESLDTLQNDKEKYKKEGFKDVFTVAFENGTRISLNEAQKKFRSTPK